MAERVELGKAKTEVKESNLDKTIKGKSNTSNEHSRGI